MKKSITTNCILLISFIVFFAQNYYAQCPVNAVANKLSLDCGDSLFLIATNDGCKPLFKNFNSGTMGTDWQATTGAVVTDGVNFPAAKYSCLGPGSEGSHFLWMGSDVQAPRQVQTNDYDLINYCPNIGGTICFWLKFSTQAGPEPCEGIDLPEEGVAFQYSINGGVSWTTINYFSPNGGYDPQMTNWNKYCYNIPAAAMTNATRFRWYQSQSSATGINYGFDTWGLDELVITLNVPGYTFDWNHDAQGPNSSPFTPGFVPVTSQYYVVTYTNGTQTCKDSVFVNVNTVTGSATATPTAICLGDSSFLTSTASFVPSLPANCGLTVSGCQGTTSQIQLASGSVNETSFAPLGLEPIGGQFCTDLNGIINGTFDQSARFQMIINKNEFPAFFKGGQIHQLSLQTLGLSSSDPANNGKYENFTIQMGCTNKTEFGSNTDFISGLVTVYNPKTITLTPNAYNTIEFDVAYDWTGQSNIVIQICWKTSERKTGNLMKIATTNFSSIHAHSCGALGCTETNNASRFQFRPNLRLGLCYKVPPVINYTWSPAGSLSNPNISNPIAKPTTTTTYTVTIEHPTAAMCNLTKTVTVNVVQPTVTITPNPANICASGGSVNLTANAIPSVAGGTITTYAWSPAAGLSNTNTANVTASPTATTTYTLIVTDSKGCSATTTVTVTVGVPPGPTAVNGSRCGTGTVSLGVTGCGGTVKWHDAASGGTLLFTGNPFTTPSISATTTYYATCTQNGCESNRTAVTATINNAPNANFNYNPATYCQTGGNATPTITGTAGTFTASPAGLSINSSTGVVTVSTSTAGAYSVTNTITGGAGCPTTTATSNITITAPPKADFQYNGSPYCKNVPNPTPVFINGGVAGTFSSTAGLVFVSTTTGQIDLATSTAGTYTITNTIPAGAGPNGCAQVTATYSITINNLKDPAFSYSASSYCKTGPNPTPTITGTPGGTFTSSPAGLIFTSSTTGTINLSASALGTYNITYTTPGPCAATLTVSVSITNAPIATFNYGNSPYCQTAANPNPTFTGGGVAGTFTSSPAGLVFVSTTTGQVNLSASTPGTYTVTNTVTASGCTPATATANITINAPKTANFTYGQAAFCQSETDPTAQITAGSVAGVFSSSPAGLVFLNTSNGLIDLSASTPNTYTITNTLAAAGGCPAVTYTQNVTINPDKNASFSYSQGTYCINGTNPTPTITGGAGGTFTATAGLVFSNPANGTVDLTATPAGTYTITYSLPAPCPASRNITFTLTNAPDATFSYGGPYCLNEVNPLPTFTAGSSAGTFSSTAGLVFVNTNTGEINLAGSTPGTYTITNTIAASGACPAVSATYSVVLNPTGNAAFSYSALEYCSTSANPTPVITGSSGGTFNSTTGLVFVNTGTGQINLGTSTAGTYSIKYLTTGGCPDSLRVNVTITNPTTPDFEYTNSPYCQTATNPNATFVNGGEAGTFSEATGNLIFNNTSTGEVNLSASVPGTYTVRNTLPANGACASVFFEANITITALPAADFVYPSSPYCLSGGNPVVIMGTNTTAGVFSKTDPNITILNPSTGEINIGASTAGTYTITNTVAANGGCPAVTATASLMLSDPANGAFTYPASPYCQTAGTANVTLGAGASAGIFSSTPGLVLNAASGQVNLSSSQVGTYKIYNSVDPGNGCPIKLDSANISINATSDATFNFAPSYCSNEPNPTPTFPAGASAGAFSATPAGLVFVSTSTGQINLTASAPGSYTITNSIAASGACPAATAADNVAINPTEFAGFSYAQSTYCAVGSDPTPAITGTTSGVFSFTPNGLSINTSTGTIDLDQSIQTTYNITYTTQGACFDDSTITLTITSAPKADFTYTPSTYCQNDPDPSPIFINGGSAGTFTAAPAGIVFLNPSTGQIDLSASAPNNYNITNTIPADGGCPAATYVSVITITVVPDAEYSYPKATYCKNESNPTVSHVTGTSGTYTATPGGLNFVSNTTGEINLATSAAGVYSIRNVVLGTGSCPNDTVNRTIEIYAMPTVNPSSNSPVCVGGDLNLAVTTTPNNTGTTFAWSGPNSFNSAIQNPTINPVTLSASGDYTIQITSNGCTSFALLTGVSITPNGPANFTPAGPFCANDNAVNLNSGSAGGKWSGTGIADSVAGVFNPDSSGVGTFMITYFNSSSCVLDSMPIQVKTLPNPSFTASPVNGCVPVASQFTSTGGVAGDTYAWTFGNGASSNAGPNASNIYSTTGCFDVSLTITSNGCANTYTVPSAVCSSLPAVANFDVTPKEADVSNPNFSFINNSQNANSYVWDFGNGGSSTSTNPIYTYNQVLGTFVVTLTANNAANCPDTIRKTIFITEDLLYFIPNSFTPDNDKFNQVFKPVFTSGYDPNDYSLIIFNRWGELIFQTTDVREGWDGFYAAELSPQGVYTWTVQFKSATSDKRIIKSGVVNLLK